MREDALRSLIACTGSKNDWIADVLIDRFGSLSAAADADYADLAEALPKKRDIALLFGVLSPLYRYTRREAFGRQPKLDARSKAGEYVKTLFFGLFYERSYLLCLDANFRLLKAAQMQHGSTLEAPVYMRLLLEIAIQSSAQYVLLTHNHPSGSQVFSLADMETTGQAMTLLGKVDVTLLDHIMVADDVAVSMRDSTLFHPKRWIANDPTPERTERWLKT